MQIQHLGLDDKDQDIFLVKRDDGRIVLRGATLKEVEDTLANVTGRLTGLPAQKEAEVKKVTDQFDSVEFDLKRQSRDLVACRDQIRAWFDAQ